MYFEDYDDDQPQTFHEDQEGHEEDYEEQLDQEGIRQPMDGIEEDDEEISSELWQEACWVVISAYFDEKGLVRQQLDRLGLHSRNIKRG
jgi:hypothetical protein